MASRRPRDANSEGVTRLRVVPTTNTPRRVRGDGGLHQRKSDGTWEATFVYEVNGIRKRRTFRGRTASEAIAKRRKATEELARGQLSSGDRITVDTLCQRWFDSKLKARVELGEIKAKTAQNYQDIYFSYIKPTLGHYQLRKLRTSDIDAMSTRMRAADLSQNSVRLARSVLRMVLDFAIAEGWIMMNPVIGSARPQVAIRVDDHPTLSVKQARLLLSKTTRDAFGPLIGVALWTGLRQGELIALRWEDLDFEANRLTVTGTTGRIRGEGLVRTAPKTKASKATIPLPRQAAALLQRQLRRQKDERKKAGDLWTEQGLVFTTPRGTPLDPRDVLRQWRRVQGKLKLPDMTFHDLRHTTATLLLSAGVPLEVVSALLRHASIRVTKDFYAKVEDPLMRRGIRSFERALGN